MPFAGVGAAVAGSVAGAAVSSALAPSPSGGGGGGSYYTPSGLPYADTAWQNQLANQQAIAGSLYNGDLLPFYQNSLNYGSQAFGQYAPGYQNAANAAGQQYTNLGQQLAGASGNQFAAGNQLYQTAFDPQNALYNRTVQQLQDQTGATNSMYGLGSSAAGAGVANQALGNFNIDWQNQQLQRQLAGVQGAGQAYGQGGALGQAGAGATLQGGQLPYQTAQGIAAYPGQLAAQYAQGIEQGPLAASQSIQGQIIPYLNYGQGAQTIPFQSQQQGAGAAGALVGQGVQQGIQGIGNAYQNAGSWGNLFGGTTGSFGGGDFSGAFTSSPYYSGGGNAYGFTM